MKNSLKLVVGVLFMVLMIGQANADARSDRQWHNRHQNDQMTRASDRLAKNNPQVIPYMPSDIRGEDGMSITCDEHGNTVDDSHTTSRCYTYHSKQTGTAWKIRYTQPNGVGEQVFKIQNHKLKLWASFNERHENIYASTDAQRYASAHSNGDNGVARNQDRENPMQEANKIDPADLIKKGLGTILPNIFR